MSDLDWPAARKAIDTAIERARIEAIAYEPPEDEAVRIDLEGWCLTHCESPGDLVAVRRYDTGEG
jgi:hypothetical protein